MIVDLSPSYRLEQIIKNKDGLYHEVIPYLWTAYQCSVIQSVSDNKYSKEGLFNNGLKNTIKWIQTDPARTVIRLWRNSDICSYCGNKIIDTKNTEGDHIVGRTNLNGASWQVPCCHTVNGNCQSSKGNRDLLVWWHKKGREFGRLSKDVLSIYIRGKYRMVENSGELQVEATEAHHHYLAKLWSGIR